MVRHKCRIQMRHCGKQGDIFVGRRDLPCTSPFGVRIPSACPAHQQKDREVKPLLGTSCRKNGSGQASRGSVGFPKYSLASWVMVFSQRCEPWQPGLPRAFLTKPSHCDLMEPSRWPWLRARSPSPPADEWTQAPRNGVERARAESRFSSQSPCGLSRPWQQPQ